MIRSVWKPLNNVAQFILMIINFVYYVIAYDFLGSRASYWLPFVV